MCHGAGFFGHASVFLMACGMKFNFHSISFIRYFRCGQLKFRNSINGVCGWLIIWVCVSPERDCKLLVVTQMTQCL